MTPESEELDRLRERVGLEGWLDHQLACFEHAYAEKIDERTDGFPTMCLYYKTGAGKTITALVCMSIWGQDKVVVIAPPSTHDKWVEDGAKLGIRVEAMSHAKFRMKDTKLKRDVAVIADEFHLFGGHTGKGWMKLDRMARGLEAPIILASATPNYNDAERVYCIQHVMAPHTVKGGFIEFLYKHCETEQDPFSMTPKVLGFRAFKDAAEYLAALPHVMYLPDDAIYTIDDFPIWEKIPPEFEKYGLNRRTGRMIGSIIEEKHARIFHALVREDGGIEKDVFTYVDDWCTTAISSVLIYCDHSTVAEALHQSLHGAALVTGKTSAKEKKRILDEFRAGEIEILIGTATLATGTDGLDKVCDWLIIVDDTEDPSLRRQVIGRILPRGKAASNTPKHIKRLVLQ